MHHSHLVIEKQQVITKMTKLTVSQYYYSTNESPVIDWFRSIVDRDRLSRLELKWGSVGIIGIPEDIQRIQINFFWLFYHKDSASSRSIQRSTDDSACISHLSFESDSKLAQRIPPVARQGKNQRLYRRPGSVRLWDSLTYPSTFPFNQWTRHRSSK